MYPTVGAYTGRLLYSAVLLHPTPTPSTFVRPPQVASPKCVVAGSTEVCHVTVCAHRGWIGNETPPKCTTPGRRRASSVHASSVSSVAGLVENAAAQHKRRQGLVFPDWGFAVPIESIVNREKLEPPELPA